MAPMYWAAAAVAAACCASLLTTGASQQASPTGTRSREPAILEHPSSVYTIGGRTVTLRCRHSAEQCCDTDVSWYRDNARVATHRDDPFSYFYLDPTGDLMLLQFSSKYAGTYYCNVTNRYGSAVSSSATVSIAYINDEFESSPKGVVATSGQDMHFSCTPPLAMPRPQVTWKTDSGSQGTRTLAESGLASRLMINTDGNGRLTLVLMNVSKADTGEYWCTAENEAGSRTSNKALLIVEDKPLFILSPEDTVAKVDAGVTLHCVARNSVTLAPISWLRDSGNGADEPINGTGRRSFLNDGNLNIQPVRADDEGRYTCLAHSSVTPSPGVTGDANARMSAYLTVDTPPYLLGRPVDRIATERGMAYFHCHADSSPPPKIIWQKANSTDFVFARSGHANRRLLVFDNGTLRISDVRPQDSGEYNCFVINRAGSTSAKANLSVQIGAGADLPPVITSPPQDAIAEIGSLAFFPCSVDGRRPVVRWLKDGRPILAGGRFSIMKEASLRIKDVRVGDSGSYTCLAMSKSGDASATAHLSVTGLANHTVQYGRLPMPPGKPRTQVFHDTAVLLTAPQLQQQAGLMHADDWSYRAEGFSYSIPEGWVATQWVRSDGKNIVFSALIPGAAFYFVLRARNSQGYVSEPSPPSDVVQIPGLPMATSSSLTQQMLDGKELIYRMPAVALAGKPYAIGSTSVNVSWAIVPTDPPARLRKRQSAAAGSSPYVEGFYVRVYSSRDSERRMDVVFSSLSTYHVINNLEPYTSYSITVTAFYAGEVGPSTKPVDVVTGEDVPTGPPLDVHVVHIKASADSMASPNASTYRVTWQPPVKRHHCGNILGYVVLFTATRLPKSSQNITVLGASSTAVELDILRPDVDYRVTVAAFTQVGLGMASKPLLVTRSPATDVGQLPVPGDAKKPVTEEPWFLPTVIGFIGLSTGAIILILVVCLCLRHRSGHRLCFKKGRFLAVPYDGARGESTTPEAYLTYRLEAADRTSSLLPNHEQMMLTNEHVMRGSFEGDLELYNDDDFRCQTPVPPYPPVPPPNVATFSSSLRGKLVEEHNLDSSGDSMPASSVTTADAQQQHRRGGRKGALYSKASVLESLGEAAVSTACGGDSVGGSAGLYATTCLYRRSQDSLVSHRDSRQVATGQAPPPSLSSSMPPSHADRFNVRGGSESSCTDNNGRSSAGTGSEAALGQPAGGAAGTTGVDECSCCIGDCSLPRGQSPRLPQFVDMLPPPPQYPYFPASTSIGESLASSGCSSGSNLRHAAIVQPLQKSSDSHVYPVPTSVATLLRGVHPPPPLLHQHSAPQMGHSQGPASISCCHHHSGESAYAPAAAVVAAGNCAVAYCPYCFNDSRRMRVASGVGAAPDTATPGQQPQQRSSRRDLARARKGSGRSDDSSTLCSRRSTDSDSATAPSALGDPLQAAPRHSCGHRPCSHGRGFGHMRYHSAASFDPRPVPAAAAPSAGPSGGRLGMDAGGSNVDTEHRTASFCPHSAAVAMASPATVSMRCPGCYAIPPSLLAAMPAGLHGTVSYPSGFTVPVAACRRLALAEEASSAAEYEEPWEDQPWLYNPSAWSGVAACTSVGGAGEPGCVTSLGNNKPVHRGMVPPASAATATSTAAAASASQGAAGTAVVRAPTGPVQLMSTGPPSDPDDEVAATMACAQPSMGDKAAADDSLDSSPSSSSDDEERESKPFSSERQPDLQQPGQCQSKASKPDGDLPSKKHAASKASARHGRHRSGAAQGCTAGGHGSAASGGYSTDSSFVFVPLPRRPYPKSARRRQMQHQPHHQQPQHHYRRHATRMSVAHHRANSKPPAGADANDDEQDDEDVTDRV